MTRAASVALAMVFPAALSSSRPDPRGGPCGAAQAEPPLAPAPDRLQRQAEVAGAGAPGAGQPVEPGQRDRRGSSQIVKIRLRPAWESCARSRSPDPVSPDVPTAPAGFVAARQRHRRREGEMHRILRVERYRCLLATDSTTVSILAPRVQIDVRARPRYRCESCGLEHSCTIAPLAIGAERHPRADRRSVAAGGAGQVDRASHRVAAGAHPVRPPGHVDLVRRSLRGRQHVARIIARADRAGIGTLYIKAGDARQRLEPVQPGAGRGAARGRPRRLRLAVRLRRHARSPRPRSAPPRSAAAPTAW